MKRNGIFIYRPPSREDYCHIKQAQEILRGLPTFWPTPDPHLTLLADAHTKNLSMKAMRRIVHPLPPTSNQAASLNIESVGVDQAGVRRSVYIVRFHTDTVIQGEYERFRRRTAQNTQRRIPQIPLHLTLGVLNQGVKIPEAMDDEIGEIMGERMSFGAVAADPKVEAPVYSEVSLSEHTDPLVTTVRLGAIPVSFLASLRPAEGTSQ